MKKVLMVTQHYLHGKGGGVFATRAFAGALAECCGQVTLLCPTAPGKEPEGLDPRIRVVPVEDRWSRVRKLLALAAGRLHRYGTVFPEMLAKESYDLVFFDTCYPTQGLLEQAKRAGCRTVTLHHNCQWEYERDNRRGPARPLMLLWLPRCERKALQESDLNLTLTEADAALLRERYDPRGHARIAVCPPFEPR